MSNKQILIIGLILAIIVFLIAFIITIVQSRKDKNFRVIKSLSLLIPISASIFGVFAIAICTVFYYRSEKTAIDTQTALFDTFLTILGIAISVWVGLNIYNVVGRNDLEDIRKESQELTKSINDIQKDSNQINEELCQFESDLNDERNRLNELKNININLLINVLINTQEDVMSGYFIQAFNNFLSINDTEKPIDDVLLSKLICIETHFHNVYRSYESSEKDRIIFFADEGLSTINSVYNSFSTKENDLIESYLVFREGEFHFYLGMANSGKQAAEEFKTSIQKYSVFSMLEKVTLPSVDYDIDLLNIEDVKLVFEDTIINSRTASYLCNTLGEAHNRILANLYKENIDSYPKDQQTTIKEYYKKTFIYFCAAVSCKDLALTDKETYSRNLGTFFEKFKLLIPGFDGYSYESFKQNCTQLEKYINKAKYCYNKSLKCSAQKAKAHIAYASAILKQISIQLNIEDRKYDSKKKTVNDRSASLFSRKDKINNDEKADKINELSCALSHFEIAQKLNPKVLDSFYGIAKAYLLLAFLENDSHQALLYLDKGSQAIKEGKLINEKNVPIQIFEKEIFDLHSDIIKNIDQKN